MSRRRICEKVRFGELKTGILLVYIYHGRILGRAENQGDRSYSKSSGIDMIIVESSYEARIEVELGILEAI